MSAMATGSIPTPTAPKVKAKKSTTGQPAITVPLAEAQEHIAYRIKTSKAGQPIIEVIEVDADVCAWVLDTFNTHNRPFSDKHCSRLAGFMLRDIWYPATQIVAFSDQGILINAQHTLGAVESSACPQQMIFAWNLNPDTQTVFDTQSKRTLVQAMKLESEDNAQAVAAIVKLDYQIHNNHGLPSSWVEEPTAGEYTRLVTQDIREAAEVALRIKGAFGGKAVVSAIGAAYLQCSRVDAADTKIFFDALELGGVPGDHPAAQVRQKLLKRETTGSMSRGEQARVYDLIIRGFNKMRAGQTNGLSWTTPKAWAFPR